MTQSTVNSGKQFFSGSASDTVNFQRPVHGLLLTTASTVGLSLDGGSNFMSITAGTYQFTGMNLLRIDFNGSGTWSGYGLP